MDFISNETALQNNLKSYCDHCGNITLKGSVGNFSKGHADNQTIYRLFRCQICEDAILYRVNTSKAVQPAEQLWPSTESLAVEAPQRVRQIYEEARAIKVRSPNSFVVQIGRALEAVMNDKKAKGRGLYQKLKWFVDEGQLPEVFAEMTDISRLLRNLGAHDADKDVTLEDAETVDEFFRAVIEYLYVAPAKVAKVKARLRR